MPRKRSKSIPKKVANNENERKVVTRNTQSKKKANVKKIQSPSDKISRKGSSRKNLLNKPLKRSRSRRNVEGLSGFQCKICFLDFKNQLALDSHKKRFQNTRYPCASCGTKFSDKEQLAIHFEHAHTGVTVPGYVYKCDVCNQVFMHTFFLHAHLFHNHRNNEQAATILSAVMAKCDKNGQRQILEKFSTKWEVENEDLGRSANSTTWFDGYGSIKSELEIVKNELEADGVTTEENLDSLKALENHVENIINSYDKYREFDRDDDLRLQYGCKPCYVSVEKLNKSMIPPFVCEFCKMTFSSEELKNNHVADGHVFIESVICDKRLPTESWMRRHFRDDHSIGCDENETCACGKNMQVHEALEEHFFQHSMRSYTAVLKPLTVAFKCKPLAKTEVCDNCGKSFWLKTCLEIHSRECSKVTDDSPDRRTLQVISKSVTDLEPNNNPNELVCRVCWAQFPTLSSLRNHVHFYARAKQYRCNICGTSFNEKSLLQTHTRDAHTYHIAYYYSCFCTICDQGFAKKIYRRIHIAHVHGDKYPITMATTPMIDDPRAHVKGSEYDGKGRKCQICNLQFVSRKRFIEHTNYFKNEEEILCRICDQRFESQHSAHRHYKLCHYPADIRQTYQHKCPICKEGFAFKIHLKAHGKHVHGKNIHGINLMRKRNVIWKNGNSDDCSAESSMAGVARYHMCAICEVSFPNLDFLTAHQTDYEMDGKFVCSRCGRRCGTSTSLLDHLSLNHSTAINDSVKCRRCDEFFLTPALWLSHIKHCHTSDVIQPSELYLEAHIDFPNKVQLSEFKSVSANNSISDQTPPDEVSMCISGINSPALTTTSDTIKDNAEKSTAQVTNQLFIRQTLFRCEVCASVFNSESSLVSHRNNLHNITSKTTEMNSLIILTQLTGTNVLNPMTMGHLIPLPKESPVQIVHEECSNEDAPRMISGSPNPNSQGTVKCEPCGFVFPTLNALMLHKHWAHRKSFPNIKCSDVGYWMSPVPLSSTINDCTRHNPPLDSLPIVRGSQTLGVNVDQERSNIIIQTVSMPILIPEPSMIINGTDGSTSCVHDKQVQTSLVHSEGINTDESKLSTSSFTKMMNNWEQSSALKRNDCVKNECEVMLKRIKREPVERTKVEHFSPEKPI